MSHELIKKAGKEGRNLLEHEAFFLLKSAGFPVPAVYLARSADEAVKIAEEIGFPVVLKIVSPQIIHKTEAGGVILNLQDSMEVRESYQAIVANARQYNGDAEITGVLVTPMSKPGLEIIVGMVRNPMFGPTVMFGLGGIFVEVFKDLAFRRAPLTKQDAEEMIKETKGYEILKGIRGQSPRDLEGVKEVLVKISELALREEQIKEIDLNPVVVYEEGLQILDARILL